MATPNNVDLFSRYMIEMYDEHEIVSVPTTFLAFYSGPNTRTTFSPNSLDVDIDIIRADEETSKLVMRGTISRPLNITSLNVQKFSSFSRKYPLSVEFGDIEGNQLLNRLAGENPYERRDRQVRMRELALRIHLESIRRQTRLFNRLAAQTILTGKQDAILGTSDTNLQYDFRRNTNLTAVPGTKWNASGTILADIDARCVALRKYGRTTPNGMFMGLGAYNAMINDTDFLALAESRRIQMIESNFINTPPPMFARFIASGWQARMRILTPGGFELIVFTSHEGYDDSGTFTYYMTNDSVLICNVNARTGRFFGPPERLPITPTDIMEYREWFGMALDAPPMPPMIMDQGANVDPGMFWCDAYRSEDKTRVTIRTQSAPIFAPIQTDAYATLTSVLT